MQSRADKSEALNPSYASQSEGLTLKLLWVLSPPPPLLHQTSYHTGLVLRKWRLVLYTIPSFVRTKVPYFDHLKGIRLVCSHDRKVGYYYSKQLMDTLYLIPGMHYLNFLDNHGWMLVFVVITCHLNLHGYIKWWTKLWWSFAFHQWLENSWPWLFSTHF